MFIDAESWKSKCAVCGEEITFPNWKCKKKPGHHRVTEKTYFHLGGSFLQNWRERRGWSPQILLRAGTEATDALSGQKYVVPTIRVIFSGQQLTTSDPEVQFYLDSKNDDSIVWGDEGRKGWERIYLTPDQQSDLAKIELEKLHKQISDQNALLEQTKSRVAGKQGSAA